MPTESWAQLAKQLYWFQQDLMHAILTVQRLTRMTESLESTVKNQQLKVNYNPDNEFSNLLP